MTTFLRTINTTNKWRGRKWKENKHQERMSSSSPEMRSEFFRTVSCPSKWFHRPKSNYPNYPPRTNPNLRRSPRNPIIGNTVSRSAVNSQRSCESNSVRTELRAHCCRKWWRCFGTRTVSPSPLERDGAHWEILGEEVLPSPRCDGCCLRRTLLINVNEYVLALSKLVISLGSFAKDKESPSGTKESKSRSALPRTNWP